MFIPLKLVKIVDENMITSQYAPGDKVLINLNNVRYIVLDTDDTCNLVFEASHDVLIYGSIEEIKQLIEHQYELSYLKELNRQ